jgi:hypothetical protein
VPKVLRSVHAEDVGGGRVIEPGEQIPSDADPEVVKRLETAGLVEQTRSQAKPSKKEE